jgi:ADP-ribose pyrophosphatase
MDKGDDSRYEVLKHQLVCKNRYFSVFLDTIGKNGEIFVEDYMSIMPNTHNNEEQITGVMTLPVNNGKYGLLKIYRHPIQKFSWELPGGFLEPNESPALSAQRELKEEVGLICKEKHLINLGLFHPSPGMTSGKVCIFSAEKCEPAPRTQEPELGISQFKWFSEGEIEEFIIDGLIHDMSTVLAIHRRAKLFNKAP